MHLSGRYGFKAAKSINEERWPICLSPTADDGARMVTTEAPDRVAQRQAPTYRVLALEENEPERVDYAEVADSGRLTDQY